LVYSEVAKDAHFIKVFDCNSCELVFEQELYEQIQYTAPRKFFHTFEGDDFVVGISFADENEAKEWLVVTLERCIDKLRVVPKTPETKKKEGMGFMKRLSISSKTPKLEISEPVFRDHLSSIGLDPKTGKFKVENIPDEWKSMFQNAGITKRDLENKKTVKLIIRVINEKSVEMVRPAPLTLPPGNFDVPVQSTTSSTIPAPPPMPKEKTLEEKILLPPPPPPVVQNLKNSGEDVQSKRGSLTLSEELAQKKLKKVEDVPPPPKDLAQTLANVLLNRRSHFVEKEGEKSSSSDEEDEDED